MALIQPVSQNSDLLRSTARVPNESAVNTQPELDGKVITDEQIVKDTFINNTAINTDSFTEATDTISGLFSGSIVNVTYFSRNTPVTDIQSRTVDVLTGFKDNAHVSYTQIRDFELRIQGSFDFSLDDISNAAVNVEAITVPGFIPKTEDIFLYELRNSKIGVFHITNVARMAIGQDTYMKITATLTDYLDTEYRDRLKTQTTIVAHFDKQKFLVGNHAFLNTEYFKIKQELIDIRPALVQTYFDRFYTNELSSFVRPDGIYDPYVVEYWNKKVSVLDEPIRPVQLLPGLTNYKKSIWSVMTGAPIRNLSNIDTTVVYRKIEHTYWDANITALIGRTAVTIGDEDSWRTAGMHKRSNTDSTVTQASYDLQAIRDTSSVVRDWHKKEFEKEAMLMTKKIYKESHRDEHYQNKYAPPYPIMSSPQLVTVWKKINNISDEHKLTDEEALLASGYIHWYRNNYPGTLSKYELETRWRLERGLPPAGKLDTLQIDELSRYIKAYRKLYAKVLADDEVEYEFKRNHTEDSSDNSKEFITYLYNYRQMHGYPADDTYTGEPPYPGSVKDYDDLSVIFTDRDKVSTLPTLHKPKPTEDINKNYYGLSNAFYEGSSMMDPFENLLYRALVQKKINPGEILDTVTQYVSITDDSLAFYQIPMCIYLVDTALRWIREHA